MTTVTDLCFLTLHELADRIRARDVSALDATQAVLERIQRLNPRLNAYITVMEDEALAAARAADEEIAAGSYRGPLHGVPVAVKDLCATKGVRTTAGAKIMSDWVPDEDATVIRRLRDAGAVIVGKTNLHEFAFGATGINPHFGPAHNPWNEAYITGGSSSGSGAAVAAGLCYAALGSDTGGSIRIPAALCGIVGIKATHGRVSLKDVVPLSWSLDHVGPLTRNVRDCALVLEAISGYDPDDPESADEPVPAWASALQKTQATPGAGEGFVPRLGPRGVTRPQSDALKGLRIGVPAGVFAETEADVETAVRKAIDALRRLGADVRDVDLPALSEYWGPAGAVLLAEAAAYHKEDIERRAEDLGEDVLQRLEAGLRISAVDYINAAQARDEIRRTCDEALFSDVDLLAMPTTVRSSVPIDAVDKDDPTLGLTRLTGQFDVTGQPAISVPCGLTANGLPVGLQLVGRRFDEATVFRAAYAFETEGGVPIGRPPID